ncbi:hypothetical protein TKK_0016250 [Trichogramma kaykai]
MLNSDDYTVKVLVSTIQYALNMLDKHGTTWHFNPPSAPHFGGLWESGVKSIIYHLKRMVSDNLFTYEKFSTLLAQIEAILNSRPLTLLPDGFKPDTVLSPAHPFIGESSIVFNKPSLKDKKLGPLEQWKRVTHITQAFWERWCTEYLLTLQKRAKWLRVNKNLVPGDVVLVKDEILPCSRWPLAE